MNKNIIIVGAIAAGLYLFSQQNKPKKAVVKKKHHEDRHENTPNPTHARNQKSKKR